DLAVAVVVDPVGAVLGGRQHLALARAPHAVRSTDLHAAVTRPDAFGLRLSVVAIGDRAGRARPVVAVFRRRSAPDVREDEAETQYGTIRHGAPLTCRAAYAALPTESPARHDTGYQVLFAGVYETSAISRCAPRSHARSRSAWSR